MLEKIIEKWFKKHQSLSKENFEMLKEMIELFEPEEKIEADEKKSAYKYDESKKEYIEVDEPSTPLRFPFPERKKFKGKLVKHIGGAPLYNLILEDIKERLKTNPHVRFENVLQDYYDFDNPRSFSKYAWAYRKELGMARPRGVKSKFEKEVEPSDKGRVIHVYNNNKVFENIYNDVVSAVQNNHSVNKVIRKYYPHVKSATIHSYASMYKRMMHDKGILRDDSVFHSKRFKTVFKRKKKRRPPVNAYKYDSVYKTFVTKLEVEKVIMAIKQTRYGYIPTTKNIKIETKLPLNRVRAVLHLLMDDGVIGYRMKDGVPIYVDKEETVDILNIVRR